MGKKWLPLESNPEVLNDFVSKLGYDTSKYAFCDVFGLDEVRVAVFHPLVRITKYHGPSGHIRRSCFKWFRSLLWLFCFCFL